MELPTFKIPDNGDPIRFELGMQFISKELILDTVKDNATEKKDQLMFQENDAVRVVVKCQSNCPFHMLVDKRSGIQY